MNMPEMPAPMMIASNSVLSAACGRSMTASESFIRNSSSDVSDPGQTCGSGWLLTGISHALGHGRKPRSRFSLDRAL